MYRKILLAVIAAGLFSMGQTCVPDTDGDGVPDDTDSCPNTPICARVDAVGCPGDGDDDGVYNGCDECADTPSDSMVYGNGCAPTGGTPVACMGPDPRAVDIQYSLVNPISDTSATIQITGVVDNIGTEDFDSNPGQQSIELWEDGMQVASQPFVDLAVGVQVSVTYQRVWHIQGAEFQPERYKLIISYDPDIYDDGNENNDDCRQANNTLLRGVDGIATLFD